MMLAAQVPMLEARAGQALFGRILGPAAAEPETWRKTRAHFAPRTSSSTPRNNMLDANHNQLQKEKECFEHHQGILEGLTEGLSKLTEKPRSEIDIDTRQDIVNRTRVIGQFIKNVLEYVDNGLV